IAGGEIDQAAGNEERRNLARSALLQEQRGVGDAGQAADPGADQGAGGAFVVFGLGMPVGIVERLACGSHRKYDEIVDLALVLRLHPLVRIEGAVAAVAARNHAGDLAGEIGDLEGLDPPRAALAVEDTRPRCVNAAAEWRNHAQPRDDNPSHFKDSSPKLAGHNKKPGDRSTTARPALCVPRGASAFRVLFKKFCRVADGQNRLCGVVGNLATELFFKCHHKLDGIETVGAEVIDETCRIDHLVGLNAEVLDHNLLNPLANLTHRSTSCLFHWTRPQDTARRYEPSWSLNFLRNRA